MSTTQKLVLDIETIGENFDALDDATRENLTRWIKKDSDNEDEYKVALWPRAFGIPSPKSGGIAGDDVEPSSRRKNSSKSQNTMSSTSAPRENSMPNGKSILVSELG